MIGGSFGRNIDILRRAMDVAMLRRNVIADNIANSDTPNFKRTVIDFESQLGRALASEKRRSTFQPLLTDSRHMQFERKIDYRTVKPRKVWDYLTTAKNNGNNVDIEEEMMAGLRNELLYETMVSVVNSEYQRVNLVLR